MRSRGVANPSGSELGPLMQAMRRHLGRRRLAFHTPGHKGGYGADPALLALVGRQALRADLTELPGLDSLLSPEGAIAQSQRLAAETFGWDWCLFSVNGGTSAVAAAMLYAASRGRARAPAKALVPTDSHISAVYGLIVSGQVPTYAATTFEREFGVPLGPSLQDLLDAAGRAGLEVAPGAAPGPARPVPGSASLSAALLTNPNYYGACPDLDAAVRLLRGYDTMVLVDEAHGSLLPFGEGALPLPATRCRADLSVVSLHKTGGSMTQTALLLGSGTEAQALQAARCLRVLQTTSPSYLLMASVEAACLRLRRVGRVGVERLVHLAGEAVDLIEAEGLRCLSRSRVEGGRRVFDPTRIVVNTLDIGMTGVEAARALARLDLECEFGDSGNVVLVLSLADSERTLGRLVRGIKALARASRPPARLAAAGAFRSAYRRVLCDVGSRRFEMTPREAFLGSRRDADLASSEGNVAAEPLFICPPGYVVVAPGERITEGTLDLVRTASEAGIRVRALGDPSGARVSVVAAGGEVTAAWPDRS